MSGSNVPPALAVQANGVAVITDANLNTFVQGATLLANLRAFVGVSNMTVWMNGTVTAGDGGQGMFYWNSSSTAADDGGATTIAPNGLLTGRWIRLPQPAQFLTPEQFGAVGNGATNDAPAIQAAINALPAGGGVIVFRPVTYAVASTINCGNGSALAASTTNGIVLLGAGGNDPFGTTGTTLKWIGAGGDTVIEFSGAMLGGGLQGSWTIDGNSLAANGLIINHVVGGTFGNIRVQNCSGVFVWLTTQTDPDPYGGCRNNIISAISIPSLPASAVGLKMDGITTINGDVLQNRIGVLDISSVAENSATALYLGYADFNVFDIVDITGTTGGTSVGVLFKGQDTSHVPFLNKFGCYANSMGESVTGGQLPWGNFIEVYDYPDSGDRIPSVAGLSGFANLSTGAQNLSLSFGFVPYGADTATPSLPGGTGTGNEVTNSNAYPVSIYMEPSAGSVVGSAHIIDVHGTDSPVPSGNYVRLQPGEKIYFASIVAGSWLWYGEVF